MARRRQTRGTFGSVRPAFDSKSVMARPYNTPYNNRSSNGTDSTNSSNKRRGSHAPKPTTDTAASHNQRREDDSKPSNTATTNNANQIPSPSADLQVTSADRSIITAASNTKC